MRQNIWILLFLICVLFALSSCSDIKPKRTVAIQIPQHPWEDDDTKLWYSLKWTTGSEINVLYISKDQREVSITIPSGESVFVCAFPLGNMRPFGSIITPFDNSSVFVLNQNDGVFAQLFMDSDRAAVAGINYPLLKSYAYEVSFDFRNLNRIKILKDSLNGNLGKSSLVAVEIHNVLSFAIPNGFWICESVLGHNILTTDGTSGALHLSEGVHRYYNRTLERELIIVVDSDGKTFHYLKLGLV